MAITGTGRLLPAADTLRRPHRDLLRAADFAQGAASRVADADGTRFTDVFEMFVGGLEVFVGGLAVLINTGESSRIEEAARILAAGVEDGYPVPPGGFSSGWGPALGLLEDRQPHGTGARAVRWRSLTTERGGVTVLPGAAISAAQGPAADARCGCTDPHLPGAAARPGPGLCMPYPTRGSWRARRRSGGTGRAPVSATGRARPAQRWAELAEALGLSGVVEPQFEVRRFLRVVTNPGGVTGAADLAQRAAVAIDTTGLAGLWPTQRPRYGS